MQRSQAHALDVLQRAQDQIAMFGAGRRHAETEREHILADARAAAERIRRDAGTAIEQGDPLHRESIKLPPRNDGVPPRHAYAAETVRIAVPPPPFSPGIFPCSRCHAETADIVDQRPAIPHETHVNEGMDCSDCHGPAGDATEPRVPSVDLCFMCHDDPEDDPEGIGAYFGPITGNDGTVQVAFDLSDRVVVMTNREAIVVPQL